MQKQAIGLVEVPRHLESDLASRHSRQPLLCRMPLTEHLQQRISHTVLRVLNYLFTIPKVSSNSEAKDTLLDHDSAGLRRKPSVNEGGVVEDSAPRISSPLPLAAESGYFAGINIYYYIYSSSTPPRRLRDSAAKHSTPGVPPC